MTVAISTTDLRVLTAETRMPFHFGNAAVTEIPKVFLRIEASVDGATQEGTAMGGLIPGWFYKDPDVSLEEGLANMAETFLSAADAARALDPEPTAFAFWRSLYERQRQWAADTGHPPLLWAYGVSLVEQATIDAVCRRRDVTFGEAVRDNSLGIDLGAFYDELRSFDPADLLPAEPRRSVAVRHTVGQTDPLRRDDVSPADRLDDGLPQTLADYVREDGVTWFKLKLAADLERDANRLARIAAALDSLGVDDYRVTLDANEGYDSAREFQRHWRSHAADPAVSPLFDRLAYVEQPLARDDAFTPETKAVLTDWDGAPPVIIDESDQRIDSAGTALAHGYAGTSHKNCKGVFKGIANACLIARRNETDPDREYVLSAEDLTTVGPVELTQDLAVAATLGVDHVERNGHHYFRGLDAFPDEMQRDVLDAHGDLYRRHPAGFPTLDVEGGRIALDSVVEAPFGTAGTYDVDQFESLESRFG